MTSGDLNSRPIMHGWHRTLGLSLLLSILLLGVTSSSFGQDSDAGTSNTETSNTETSGTAAQSQDSSADANIDSEPAPSQPPTPDATATTPEPGTEDESKDESSNSDDKSAEEKEPGAFDKAFAQVDAVFGKGVEYLEFVLFNSLGTEYLFGTKIPFVVLWLLVGASFLTVRMGFVNIRAFWHAIRLTKGDYDNPNEKGEVSHFQALSSALSATVGLGNIAGVAIAVGSGGPGAVFWMVMIGLLGMTSKFTECTLGQMYRKINQDGTVSGGPMHYLKDGLRDMNLGPLGLILSTLFVLLCIGASFGGGNSFQVGQSLDAIRGDLPVLDKMPYLYGLGMAFLAGLVIIGGIRSIGRVAGIIVPFMCAAYVLMALYILITNASLVPAAFGTIVGNAFSLEAGLGGLLGVLVVGIQRAVFSNEAGTGSAAIAHSAAKTDEPVSEGIVALLEPFIDTVLVCTMTGLVIIIAGGEWTPNEEKKSLQVGDTVVNAEGQEVTVDAAYRAGLPLGKWSNEEYADYVGVNAGAALTKSAVSGKFGLPIFKWILFAAVVLFAFSTLISWSYYGERCFTSLFGMRSSMVYKILFLIFTVLGSIVTKGNILAFSDLFILSMALPNILGLYLLSGKVRRELDTYMEKVKNGKIAPHK